MRPGFNAARGIGSYVILVQFGKKSMTFLVSMPHAALVLT